MYNKKQVGKIYRGAGGQLEQTSDFYNVFQTGTDLLAASGNPFASILSVGFGFLDNLFCGERCHARRAARAAGGKVSGMCNCNHCGVGQINNVKPKIF